WSIATSMMGVATGFKSLLALRLALGVGEAAAYPSNAGITARWFPDKERATVSGLFDSASKFGGAIAMPLIVWMIYTFDWRLTFLIIGSVGILWVIAWYFIYA
ncbi:MFS transporter, partial [Klebsiella pneumoniae]|nr:MFS transporter [Klebsiella pneumoniae]